MKKVLKWSGIVIGGFFIVIVFIVFMVNLFISPESKALIDEEIKQQTVQDSIGNAKKAMENAKENDFDLEILWESEPGIEGIIVYHVLVKDLDGDYLLTSMANKIRNEVCTGKCVLMVWDDADAHALRKYKFDYFTSENFPVFMDLMAAQKIWEAENYVSYAEHQLFTEESGNLELWPLMDKKYIDLGGKKSKTDMVSY